MLWSLETIMFFLSLVLPVTTGFILSFPDVPQFMTEEVLCMVYAWVHSKTEVFAYNRDSSRM